MPVPVLFCPVVPSPGSSLCIRMPGGARICSSWLSSTPPTLDDLMRQFLASLSTALAPLAPIFTIVDVVAELIGVVKAIATLNPKEIAEALPALAKKLVQLLALLPQAAIPIMILDILTAIITFINGYAGYLNRVVDQINALAEAANYAAQASGISALLAAVACGQQQLDEFLAASSQGMEPINALLAAVNGLMEVIGLGQFAIPPLGDVSQTNIGEVAATLEEVTSYLLVIREAIPI